MSHNYTSILCVYSGTPFFRTLNTSINSWMSQTCMCVSMYMCTCTWHSFTLSVYMYHIYPCVLMYIYQYTCTHDAPTPHVQNIMAIIMCSVTQSVSCKELYTWKISNVHNTLARKSHRRDSKYDIYSATITQPHYSYHYKWKALKSKTLSTQKAYPHSHTALVVPRCGQTFLNLLPSWRELKQPHGRKINVEETAWYYIRMRNRTHMHVHTTNWWVGPLNVVPGCASSSNADVSAKSGTLFFEPLVRFSHWYRL